jgi:magnesium transporter
MDVTEPGGQLSVEELRDGWPVFSPEERLEGFSLLPREDLADFFLSLTPRSQSQIVLGVPEGQRRLYVRLLAPDDAADVLSRSAEEERAALLNLVDETTRREITALLAYAKMRPVGS